MPAFAHIQEEIAAMLDIPDGELTEEQRAAMDAYLDELAGQEAEKVDAFASFLRLESARAKACREEGGRLLRKAAAAERRLAWLKNSYVRIMEEHGLRKISGEVYTLSLRKSQSVKAPEDPEGLARLYETDPLFVNRKITLTPDKRVIGEALKSGIKIPGCGLEENFSLQVR